MGRSVVLLARGVERDLATAVRFGEIEGVSGDGDPLSLHRGGVVHVGEVVWFLGGERGQSTRGRVRA